MFTGVQSSTLHYVALNIVDHEECQKKFVAISSAHLCAGGGGKLRAERKTDIHAQLCPNIPNYVCNDHRVRVQSVLFQTWTTLFAGQDACQGDSGGPLVSARRNDSSTSEEFERYEIIGVTSFGDKCGEIGSPGKIA